MPRKIFKISLTSLSQFANNSLHESAEVIDFQAGIFGKWAGLDYMIGRLDGGLAAGVARQLPGQAMEQEDSFLYRFGDAGQAKLAAITKVEPNLDHQDGAKASRARAGVIDWATTLSFCLRQTDKQ